MSAVDTAQPSTVQVGQPAVAQHQIPANKPAAKTPSGWLFSPTVDLLVVANVTWPLMAIVTAMYAQQPIGKTLGFLVAYFLIMPHRWITLALVFLDPHKFAQFRNRFLGIGLAIVLTVCLTQLTMGALTLLLAVDLLWNAWHFAAQHGGIARIYARMARPGDKSTGLADKIVLRTLVMYAVFRMTGAALPDVAHGREWLTWIAPVMSSISVFDYLVMALPVGLLAREFFDLRRTCWGRISYLFSISTLYGLMIYSVSTGMTALTIGCAAGATLCHSAEYLAIVSWYVKKNKSLSQTKPFCYFVPRWAVVLVAFMSACLLSAALLKANFLYAWVFLNVIISFMHYAYDGMIWKRPATAKVANA